MAGGLVAVVAIAAAVGINANAGTKSPNEIAGATLTVVTAEGNQAEQALVNFVAEEVAPKYGIKVAFKGLADSTTLNRAVSTGEVAATVYQHKLWLSQVLEANQAIRRWRARRGDGRLLSHLDPRVLVNRLRLAPSPGLSMGFEPGRFLRHILN